MIVQSRVFSEKLSKALFCILLAATISEVYRVSHIWIRNFIIPGYYSYFPASTYAFIAMLILPPESQFGRKFFSKFFTVGLAISLCFSLLYIVGSIRTPSLFIGPRGLRLTGPMQLLKLFGLIVAQIYFLKYALYLNRTNTQHDVRTVPKRATSEQND